MAQSIDNTEQKNVSFSSPQIVHKQICIAYSLFEKKVVSTTKLFTLDIVQIGYSQLNY